MEALRRGACDLGFVEGPWVPDDLHRTVVGRDRLAVVVAPGHPWARRRRPLSGRELADTPLLLREPGSGTRETLQKALRPYDGPAVPVLELGSTAPLRSAVARGARPRGALPRWPSTRTWTTGAWSRSRSTRRSRCADCCTRCGSRAANSPKPPCACSRWHGLPEPRPADGRGVGGPGRTRRCARGPRPFPERRSHDAPRGRGPGQGRTARVPGAFGPTSPRVGRGTGRPTPEFESPIPIC
ncbi:LysR substrate-binding domain-containing protein [Yinghuangia aomiensis]